MNLFIVVFIVVFLLISIVLTFFKGAFQKSEKMVKIHVKMKEQNPETIVTVTGFDNITKKAILNAIKFELLGIEDKVSIHATRENIRNYEEKILL